MDKSVEQPLRQPPQPEGEITWIAGGDIDRSSACLRFWGDDLQPDEISKKMGVQPSKAWKKGDVFHGKTHDLVRHHGPWLYRIYGWGETDLEDRIAQLLAALPKDLAIWQDVMSQYEGELFCGLSLERWNGMQLFSPDLMQQISERGLALNLDIYFNGDEE